MTTFARDLAGIAVSERFWTLFREAPETFDTFEAGLEVARARRSAYALGQSRGLTFEEVARIEREVFMRFLEEDIPGS